LVGWNPSIVSAILILDPKENVRDVDAKENTNKLVLDLC